jgi:hypothetical protein
MVCNPLKVMFAVATTRQGDFQGEASPGVRAVFGGVLSHARVVHGAHTTAADSDAALALSLLLKKRVQAQGSRSQNRGGLT